MRIYDVLQLIVILSTGADSSVYDNRQGMRMRNTSIHQGLAQGDNEIGITTRVENIYFNDPGEARGGNPYDDPHAILQTKMGFSQDGIYDNPSQIGEVYVLEINTINVYMSYRSSRQFCVR